MKKSTAIIAAIVVLSAFGFMILSAQKSAPGLINAPSPDDQENPEPQTKTVSAYFSNSEFDPEVSCYKVFPVERQVAADADLMRASLEATLAGPTDEEKTKGYFTSLNPGTKLNTIRQADGAVYLDFDQQLDFQVGGSCRVGAIRAQITQTAKQFAGVNEVVISILGNVDEILQP